MENFNETAQAFLAFLALAISFIGPAAVKLFYEAWKQARVGRFAEQIAILESLAIRAVEFVEVLDLQDRLYEIGRDKKGAAVETLREWLLARGITVSTAELDAAIESAWFRIFYGLDIPEDAPEVEPEADNVRSV